MQMTQPSPPPAACAAAASATPAYTSDGLSDDGSTASNVDEKRICAPRCAHALRSSALQPTTDDDPSPASTLTTTVGRLLLGGMICAWVAAVGADRSAKVRSPPIWRRLCARPSSLAVSCECVLRRSSFSDRQLHTSPAESLSSPSPPSRSHPHSQCAARSPSRRRAPAALLRGSRGAAALNRLDLGGGNLFGGGGPPRTDRLARASLLRGTLGQARLVDDVLERGLEPTRSRAVDVLRGCPGGR